VMGSAVVQKFASGSRRSTALSVERLAIVLFFVVVAKLSRMLPRPGHPTGQVVSILVGHHHGDGGLRVVNVERAARRNQLDELGAVVVVSDVELDGDAVNAGPCAEDREAELRRPSGVVCSDWFGD
jgi:hypothetical protein